MSEPIKAGDLVYVYWTHCPHDSLGVPFQVKAICSTGRARCVTCLAELGSGLYVTGRFNAFVSQVKRIPPLSELEGEKRDEDLKVPA